MRTVLKLTMAVGYMLLSTFPAAAQCSARASARLSAAGYTGEQAAAVCAAYRGAIDRSAALYLGALATDRLLNAITPLAYKTGEDKVYYIDQLKYCGAVGNEGRVLATARTVASAPSTNVVITASRDLEGIKCDASLASIAVAAAPAVAAELRVAWRPWQLDMRVHEASDAKLAAVANSISVPLGGVPMPIAQQSVPFNGIVYFQPAGWAIVAIPASEVADGAPTAVPPASVFGAGATALGAMDDISVRLGADALQYVAATYFNGANTVTLDVGALGKFVFHSLSGATGPDSLTLHGVAGSDTGEKYAVTARFDGPTLALSSVSIVPSPDVNCNDLDFVEALSCNARRLSATGVAAAAMGVYRGRPLQEMGRPGVMAVDLGDRRFQLVPTITAAAATPDDLRFNLRLMFERSAR